MDMDIVTYRLETNINGQVQIHTLQTLPMMAAQQFQNLAAQAIRSLAPCKVKMIKYEKFWSELDQKFTVRETALEFRNNAYGNRD